MQSLHVAIMAHNGPSVDPDCRRHLLCVSNIMNDKLPGCWLHLHESCEQAQRKQLVLHTHNKDNIQALPVTSTPFSIIQQHSMTGQGIVDQCTKLLLSTDLELPTAPAEGPLGLDP